MAGCEESAQILLSIVSHKVQRATVLAKLVITRAANRNLKSVIKYYVDAHNIVLE